MNREEIQNIINGLNEKLPLGIQEALDNKIYDEDLARLSNDEAFDLIYNIYNGFILGYLEGMKFERQRYIDLLFKPIK